MNPDFGLDIFLAAVAICYMALRWEGAIGRDKK